LDKLFLNFSQPFLPLDMSDLRFCSVLAAKAIPIIQRLNVRNLRPKTRNLFPKDFKGSASRKGYSSLLFMIQNICP
jgi:hypothetical protein